MKKIMLRSGLERENSSTLLYFISLSNNYLGS